jgi:hypothetical protein
LVENASDELAETNFRESAMDGFFIADMMNLPEMQLMKMIS